MRYHGAYYLSATLLLLCSCIKQPAQPPQPVPEKLLVAPVGKHWQVIEEAPTLTNERNEQTLPFQRDPLLVPPGGAPVAVQPGKKNVETPTR